MFLEYPARCVVVGNDDAELPNESLGAVWSRMISSNSRFGRPFAVTVDVVDEAAILHSLNAPHCPSRCPRRLVNVIKAVVVILLPDCERF